MLLWKKTSVPLLCTISTKSKVGTEFMKSFEIEAHLPPLQRRRDGVKLFWVLTTETEKGKQFVRYSPPSVYHYALVTSIYHQARELPLVLQHFEFERVHG